MDGLGGSVADGAPGEGLLGGFGSALIALGDTLYTGGKAQRELLWQTVQTVTVSPRTTIPTFLMTVTCPRYPAVPLSIRGISAARHIRFTWFRATVSEKDRQTRSPDFSL